MSYSMDEDTTMQQDLALIGLKIFHQELHISWKKYKNM
jgi:hypothetical protein